MDVVFSAGWAGSQAPSEERHWTDQNDNPIQQTTTLQRVPITVSLKYYLRPQGRAVGRFVWVPRRVSCRTWVRRWADVLPHPSVGELRRPATPSSAATVRFGELDGTAHVFAGVDVPLGPRFVMSVQARYAYASTPLGPDFGGFGSMNLSGFSATVGMGVRF